MNKNIIEVCLSPDLGGLELFVVSCYDYFKQQTNCFITVAPNKKLSDYLDKKFLIKRNKFFPLIPALKLAKLIDDHDIDVLHFHWTRDIITVVLAKLFSKKKPKIIQTRNMHITRFKDDFFHRFLYKNIDAIHAVTDEVKKELETYIPKDVRPDIKTVYMGVKKVQVNKEKLIQLKEKYDLKNQDFIVGIVGRIEEAKGQWMLIEAISKLKDLNIKAMIVGHTMDEDYLQNLKEKVKKLDIEDKVIFTGFTKEVNEHIKLCNCTVLATQNETFGLVVVESMINKVPVIATNKGGPTQIIDNQQDGMLFDRSVEDLTQKIKILYHDREFLNFLSENAYKKALERFEYNTQLEKLKRFIDEG